MTWAPLSICASPDVIVTTTKKLVAITLGPAAIRRLGWSEDEPNVTVALGDGENAGWLRVALDEEGTTPEQTEGRLVLTLPRSMLPDIQDCRGAPLVWRPAADSSALEIRLPTVAAGRRPSPRLAAINGKPTPTEPTLEVIAVPELYVGLHSTAWANGVELMFLSDGNVSVNGKITPADDVESLVRDAVERRNSARQRAS